MPTMRSPFGEAEDWGPRVINSNLLAQDSYIVKDWDKVSPSLMKQCCLSRVPYLRPRVFYRPCTNWWRE